MIVANACFEKKKNSPQNELFLQELCTLSKYLEFCTFFYAFNVRWIYLFLVYMTQTFYNDTWV